MLAATRSVNVTEEYDNVKEMLTLTMPMNNQMKINELARILFDADHPFNVDCLLDCACALFGYVHHEASQPNSHDKSQLKISLLHQIESAFRPSIKHFETVKLIGKGAFGNIHLVRHIETGDLFALKTMKKVELIRKSDSAFFWEERNVMLLSDSEWIIRLHHAFQDSVHLYMVTEFAAGGDLVGLMSRCNITEDMAKFYTAEMTLAIIALHEMGYIHRDIKPDNILIDQSGHIKLTDFGTCVKVDEDGLIRNDTAVGTPDYICPELLQCQGQSCVFGKEIDWWSLGVVIYELIVGDTPFYAESLVGTYSKILAHAESLKFPTDLDISDYAKHFICSLLTDRSHRLGYNSPDEIKAHPFFQNANWNWENIRQAQPPFIPLLLHASDTKYFDEIEFGIKKDATVPDDDGLYDCSVSRLLECPGSSAYDQIDHMKFAGFSFSKDLMLHRSGKQIYKSTDVKCEQVSINEDRLTGSQETARPVVAKRTCAQLLRQRRTESFPHVELHNQRVQHSHSFVVSALSDGQFSLSTYPLLSSRNSKTGSADSAISTSSQSSAIEPVHSTNKTSSELYSESKLITMHQGLSSQRITCLNKKCQYMSDIM